jgi:hypothetical protein
MGPGTRHAIHAPDHRCGGLGGGFHARLDLAVARTQVRAEPGHNEGHGLTFGQRGVHPVQRGHQIGQAFDAVLILRGGGAVATRRPPNTRGRRGAGDGLGRIDELACGRDQVYRAHETFHRARIGRGPDHLEGQLRKTVAEGLEGQILEDDVGHAAIGRGLPSALLRLDEGIGHLAFRPKMHPDHGARHIEGFAIGPDATDAADRTLAKRHGEGGVIPIALGHHLGPAAFAAALGLAELFLAEIRRPDDVPAQPHRAVETWDHGAFGCQSALKSAPLSASKRDPSGDVVSRPVAA